MIQELSQALDLITQISKSTKAKLLSPEELTDAKNNIAWLERTKENLIATIQQSTASPNFSDDKVASKTIVDLNREIGDIAQCIEDIHASLILAAQRYVEFLDTQSTKKE